MNHAAGSVARAEQPKDRRFPRRVYAVGTEPDPRFTLANERTFLAWIRTSLALAAVGVALEAFALPLDHRIRLVAAILLLGLGAVLPGLAWSRWAIVERTLRCGDPLPGFWLGPVVAVGTAAAIAVLIVAVICS